MSISIFNAKYELNVSKYTYCLTTIEKSLCRVKRDAKQCPLDIGHVTDSLKDPTDEHIISEISVIFEIS